MKQAILSMLEMQEEMNTRVHDSWRDQNFEWYRAIWIECAELMDHYGYKWWKHQEPDEAQVQLEIVDIWHFGMSCLLQNERDEERLASNIALSWKEQRSESNFREIVEALAAEALNNRTFSVSIFSELCNSSELSFPQLYSFYIGKNVLNFFRQDNGYKEGSYKKIWGGREDNDHLNDLLNTIDNTAANFSELLYKALEDRYSQV